MVKKDVEMHIVFVHLGHSKADHLWLNLKRVLTIIPNQKVTVILDDDSHLKNVPSGVSIYKYQRKDDLSHQDALSSKDQKFRQGFWRFSLERIFAIIEFHEQNPQLPLLHFESDVLIFPGFPISQFQNLEKITWNKYNQDRDVLATLYLPTILETNKFKSRVITALESDPTLTDMTVLNRVHQEFKDDYLYFPAIEGKHSALLNQAAKIDEEDLCDISKNHANFAGVFDGAAMGMWLTGHDPRNNYGKYKIHDYSPIVNGDSYIDPSKVSYILSDSGTLEIITNGSKTNVWTLHIHSKNLELFGMNWKMSMQEFVVDSVNKAEISKFDFNSVIKMFLDSVEGGNVDRFLIGLPFVHLGRRQIIRLLKFLGIYTKLQNVKKVVK